MEKHKSKIDIPVLILFFNRPELLKLVFEQFEIARPKCGVFVNKFSNYA